MKIIELHKVSELEKYFQNEIQIFSKTLFTYLNGRSHVIFSLGFCTWKEIELTEMINAKWRFGKVLLFPLIKLSKSFEFTHFQSINHTTIKQNYLFNIKFQNLEFWDVTGPHDNTHNGENKTVCCINHWVTWSLWIWNIFKWNSNIFNNLFI